MEISVSEFKAKCLKLMDDVARTREPLIVTRHGRPLVRIEAADVAQARDGFGVMAQQTEIIGDIVRVPDGEWFDRAEDRFYDELAAAERHATYEAE